MADINPVGTKEQREELRRQKMAFLSPTERGFALDGLDIAEEMAKAAIQPLIRGGGIGYGHKCRLCDFWWPRGQEEGHREGCALAEWGKWKANPRAGP